jgi:hypothetical protein
LSFQFSRRGLTHSKAISSQIDKELLDPLGVRLGGRLETAFQEGERLRRVRNQSLHGGLACGGICITQCDPDTLELSFGKVGRRR